MKHLFLLAALLISSFALRAQGGPPGGPGVADAAIGHLFGKLVDAAGKGIANGSVLVLRAATGTKYVLLKGVTTNSNGAFSIEDLPAGGPLKLSISAVGYKPFTEIVSITPPDFDKDLGKLALETGAKELEEVVVTAAKPTMSVDMDKKVFNVSKDVVSIGGSGLDVLKNVPSVNVDLDGNVTLRGGSPQLLVDGLPTTLTLDEIPSDAIESVEVITNPGAKYDASGGGAGILNIVLKKNKKTGYNGNLRAGVDSYGQTSLGGNFNYRENKINVTSDLNIHSINDWEPGSINRTALGDTPVTVNQEYRDTTKGGMIFGRLGVDYFISNRTTLSLTGFAMHHSATTTDNIGMYTGTIYSGEEINGNSSFNGRGLSLAMKHLFRKEKEEWTANGNYFSGNAVNNSLYATNYYTEGPGSALNSTEWQKILGSGNDHNIFLQTDYTNPLTPKTTLEAGLKASLQSRLNINNNYTYDPDSAAYLLVPSAASNYRSKSNVYAAYADLASSVGNFSYKLGLRAESSNYNGTLLNSGETFSNQYPVSLFPSVFLSEKLGEGQELQLSYTRRVNRPNFQQLIPYTDSSNKLNITRGNPDLVPEFTQSVELSYLKNYKGNNTIMGSVYYKYTDHLITGYIQQDTDATTGATTLINTYINANSSYSIGAELTAQNSITKWWDVSANINLYNSKINTGALDAVPQEALWSWFGKVNTTIRLPGDFALQVSGLYQSKTNLPVNTNQNQPGPPNMQSTSASQGYIKPFYEVDLGVKKSFLKNKLSLSLSYNDIFRSRVQDQYSYSVYFVQDYSRIHDPRMLKLNLMYNFGKVDASLFRRKNNNVETSEE